MVAVPAVPASKLRIGQGSTCAPHRTAARSASSRWGDAPQLLPARTWEEYLNLGVSEIRHYGAGAPQVTRRLRAALESLQARVRPEHRAALQAQLDELAHAVDRRTSYRLEREFATTPDHQGIGRHASAGHSTGPPRISPGLDEARRWGPA
jgi:hypothetical protein